MAEVLHVTDESFDADVTKSNVPVVLDFWAPWCGPCRMMEPVLDELAKDHGESLKVAKLNVDENPEVARRFDVLSIPTLLVFDDGDVAKKIVGARPKKALVDELAPWLGA